MLVPQKYRASLSFVEFPKQGIHQSIPQRFEQLAREYSKKPAVKFQEIWVTYEELNQTANQLARLLPPCSPGQTLPIGLLMNQGITLIVSILATLKAGLTYVPIDGRQPEFLLEKTLKDLQPSAVLADDRHMAMAERSISGSLRVINAEKLGADLSGANLDLQIAPEATAYIYFTSGSTGSPKGVMDTHRNVLHNVMRYTNSLAFSPEDRMSLVQHNTFSGTVSTIFGALLNGATVYPFDLDGEGLSNIASWVQQERITIFHAVPSIFRQLANYGESFPNLRLIRLEGDRVTPRDIELFQKISREECILVNGLGATECGLIRQYFIEKNMKLPDQIVPVGYPVEDMTVQIMDDSNNKVTKGICGEIVVQSPYLAIGYWQNPELTAARFSQEGSGVRTYRTGDWGTIDQSGCLEIRGRKDFQRKIRGIMVDLADVEQTLLENDAFKHALVQVYSDEEDEQHLVAYLVPHSHTNHTANDIREFLQHRVPQYMIPDTYIFLEELPLTRDGKINHHGLPIPSDPRNSLTTPYVPPTTPTENSMVKLWAEVLKLEKNHIGVSDSFFELGGESLRATRLANRLEQKFNMRIPVALLFEHTTIRDLIDFLNQGSLSKTNRLQHTSDRAAQQRKNLTGKVSKGHKT